MILVVSIIGGIIFLILSTLIAIKKDLSFVPTLTEEKIKKIKKKDKASKEFAVYLFFISIAFFATAILTLIFGKIGMYIGLVLLIISALMWTSLTGSVDEKIRRNKY